MKTKQLRTNERIRISPIRLIDHENNQVGIVDTARALEMAREVGLDLVEVSPDARPPVCKIIDYGKWKYQQKKKEQKAKSHSKVSEMKEVRLRPSTDDHDLSIKLEKARAFLADGHKVQFTMMFKGRQNAHKDIGYKQFQELVEQFADVAKVEVPARAMGRRMTMIVAPLPKGAAKKPKPEGDAKAAPPAPKPPAPQQTVPPSEGAA